MVERNAAEFLMRIFSGMELESVARRVGSEDRSREELVSAAD